MQLGLPHPGTVTSQRTLTVGGVVSIKSLKQVMDADRAQAAKRASEANDQPVVQSLVSHIRKHWAAAKQAKQSVEADMLRALRALRGEYDPDKLAKIKAQNGSQIYMMLFATKARQAKALLGDVLLGTTDDKPWTISPSPVPELPEDVTADILKGTAQLVAQAEMSGLPMSVDDIRQMLRDAKERAEVMVAVEARARARRAEKKIEDMLVEGGFVDALDAFLDDLTVFKTAFIKGPVIRRRGSLEWMPGPSGFEPQVTVSAKPHWERVDPLMIYPASWSRGIDDGYLIERHRLTPQSLTELIGVDGYSEDAIRQVLDASSSGELTDWIGVDAERADAEGRSSTSSYEGNTDLIDALQYWGHVSGKMLLEWGMTPEEIDDEAKMYAVEAWLVGRWVIKAAINNDPLARKPYYSDSYKRQPGAFWGMSLYDTMSDCQDMCNSAARALTNNLAISSGPQVWVNVDRIPVGEDISELYPWKITQVTNDPMGTSSAPMGFFQPTSNAAELMAVYEKFSILADEYTGVPRYMTGDGNTSGAGRTASGMSMMIGNAGKTIKSAVSSIDSRVISPAVERCYEFVLRYVGDPDMKGDLNIVARGALSLVARDSAQVRRNEFLNIALNSPVVQQMIGPEGIAELLRSTTRTLDLESGDIVPSTSEVKMRVAAMQAAAAAQAQAEAEQGTPAKPPQKKKLVNEAPVTDNFGA